MFTPRAMRLRSFAFLLAGSPLFACGGDDVNVPPHDGGASADSPGDSPADHTSPTDTGSDTTSPVDAGVDAPADATTLDAPADAPLDAPIDSPADVEAGPAPPPGTLLQPGQNLTLWGVTGDGYAAYTDGQGNLYAASIATGARQTITTGLGNFLILFSGNVVVVWRDVPAAPQPAVSALGVWTSANGYKAASTASSVGLFAVSGDSARVLFVGNVNAAGTVGDAIGTTTDFTAPATLSAALSLDPSCTPALGFGGVTAQAPAVVGHCPQTDAGAATSAVLTSYSGASWTAKDLLANAKAPPWFSPDRAGQRLFSSTSANAGVVVALSNAAATPIDTALSTGPQVGFMTGDGSAVVYATAAGSLKRSPAIAPSPSVLIATGIGGLYPTGFSPTETSLLYFTNLDSTTFHTDLFLASAITTAAPTTLSATTTATVYGDTFTTDGTHALFYSPVDPVTLAGTLHAGAFGAAPTQVGTNVWIDYALSGSTIAFNDGVTSPAASNKRADLEIVDVATSNAPKRLVTQADVGFWPTAAKDKLVYTYNVAPQVAGLYIVLAQ